ncbi:MAG: TetR/AcrR family transcriptional regulator [Thermoleophilia bacterium]|nr:TetR/AcrR family transcriptional regulator [Thermoleophilia bacterium]
MPTRERILREASFLFARKGYGATSTREIGEAVGIRQPSLFHHFASKAEIMMELLAHSLGRPTDVAEALAAADGPATGRLHRYLVFDALHIVGSPYDLGGLNDDDVMELPEFREWHALRARLRGAREEMVAQGIRDGEFIDVGVEFAAMALTNVIISATQVYSGRLPADPGLAMRIAVFAMRGLVIDPAALDDVAAWDGRDAPESAEAPTR